MSNTRDQIKAALPASLLGAMRDTRDALQRTGQAAGAALHPWRRETVSRLAALKDSHKGERCFIMGNGPSLKNTDLSRLKNEFTLGTNRIYLAFPEMGFKTSFYVSINDLVVEQCADDILKLDMPRFISWHSHKWLQQQDDLYFLLTSYTGPKFEGDATHRLWEGGTVTYVALQVAFYLGFQQAILIGVDHSFVTQGKPNTTVISQGDDPNHFNPGYFGKGFRWQLPDLEASEQGYRLARLGYEAAGREVLDATVGGKLTIFKKVDYLSLFEK
jgi:hypothetical protein